MANKLYISKRTGVVILIVFFLVLIGSSVAVYSLLSRIQLVSPSSEYKPITDVSLNKTNNVSSSKVADVASSNLNKSTTADSPPQKLTIIFFYDGYDTQSVALTYVAVLKEVFNELEPFKSMGNFIDYKIFTTDSRKCHTEGSPALLVCDPKLIDSFRKLGVNRFKVVILSPDAFTSAAQFSHGENSWITISTNQGSTSISQFKQDLGVIFSRLLGHSLGLQYEYSDAANSKNYSPPPPPGLKNISIAPGFGKPNCAPDLTTAKKWWGDYINNFPDEVGFNLGCGGSPNYYFPVKSTLMSDNPKAQSYGVVSEDYLRGVLSCFYGNGNEIVYPASSSAPNVRKSVSCPDFEKEYPNFWGE